MVPFQVLIVENPYERRPRRKMVKDPVTGVTNQNPKQSKSGQRRKGIKVSQQQTFVDLRPLDQFQSKLITKNRITVIYFNNNLTIA